MFPGLFSLGFLLFLSCCTLSVSSSSSQPQPHRIRGSSSRALQFSPRIVGGNAVIADRYPYFTFIRIATDRGNFQCGGTLIHSKVVMTAGHCYHDFSEQGIEINSIKVIVNRTTDDFETEYEYARDVEEVIVHPNYTYRGTINDVALMQLNETVPNVALPSLSTPGNDPPDGAIVTALGRGTTSDGGPIADELRSVDLDVISHTDCNDEDSYKGSVKEDVMLCAGKERGGKDACSGDSGGPLIVKGNSPEEDMVIGLTSWGAGCARIEKFGVYSRVSAFAEFIEDGVCQLSSGSNRPALCYENKLDFGEILSDSTPVPAPVGSPDDLDGEVAASCKALGEDCESHAECCFDQCRKLNYDDDRRICFGPRGEAKQSLKLSNGGGAGGVVRGGGN